MSFSGPLIANMHLNGFPSAVEVKVEVEDVVDLEQKLPVAQIHLEATNNLVEVKEELIEKADEAPAQEQTPPTSPPPLHYPKNPIKKEKLLINPMNVIKNKMPGVIKKEFSSGLIKQKLVSKSTEVVIDLTDEAIDCDSPPAKRFHCEEHDPLAFSFVDMGDMPSSGIEVEKSHLDREYSRVMKKVGMKMGPKRPRFDHEYERIQRSRVRECKVLVVDVMKEMVNEVFQQHMKVKMRPVRLKMQSDVS